MSVDAQSAVVGAPFSPENAVGTEGRELTLDEVLSIAAMLQQQGRIADGEKLCRTVLEAFPGNPDALHFLALAVHRRGGHAEAVGIIEGILAEHPDHADAWSNLGIFHRTAGRIDEAAAAFERAISLEPRHVNAWSNLGIARRAQGRIEEAEAAYRQALEINPTHAGAWHNLAGLLESRGRTADAVIAYSRACVNDPANTDSKRMLAHAYWTLGENDKAAEVLRSWLLEQPGNPIAAHLLAACGGSEVPERASDACVEHMFDSFADTFDAKLRKLRYQAPELVTSILAEQLAAPDGSLAVADAGCGTGLCGPLLAPYARKLTGVDLSAGMLKRASERGIYHELVKAELTAYFELHPEEFDVIVSADTLVYFGPLDRALTALTGALKPGGMLAFTLERTAAENADGFVLEGHGRYTHTERYVRQVLAAALTVKIVEVELRMESGLPVPGLLVLVNRPATSPFSCQ